MADETVGVADSAPVADAATASSGLAAEQTDATHGDATHETPESTPETVEGQPPADESADVDDDEAEQSDPPDLSEEEKKTRSQERRERRQKRDQARIDKAVADAIATREQADKAAALQREAQAAAQKAHQARLDTFSEALGVPDAPDKPGTMAQLQREIDEGNRQIRAELTNPQDIDLDAITAQVAQADAKLSRLRENNALAADLQDFIWSQINEGGFARVGEIPEMAADPDAIRRYNGQKDVHAAHQILAETVRKSVTAAKDAEIATLTEKHASQMKALEADRNGWRVRAGGGEATTATGGQSSTSPFDLTPERYAGMSFEERQKLRSTPEGRAQIDQMSRRQSGAA